MELRTGKIAGGGGRRYFGGEVQATRAAWPEKGRANAMMEADARPHL